MRKIYALMLIFVLCVGMASCGKTDEASLWADAMYNEDTELGSGTKKLTVEVEAEEKTVVFTINTDEKTVGDAMAEHNLISGEQGAYGLYVKTVNGITADYDETQSYWAFNKNGEAMMTGVDGAEFEDGESFELVYTK